MRAILRNGRFILQPSFAGKASGTIGFKKYDVIVFYQLMEDIVGQSFQFATLCIQDPKILDAWLPLMLQALLQGLALHDPLVFQREHLRCSRNEDLFGRKSLSDKLYKRGLATATDNTDNTFIGYLEVVGNRHTHAVIVHEAV